MEVKFMCKEHGARNPKNASKGGLAVDLVCDICGEKCNVRYEDSASTYTKETVYPEIYGEKK